MPSHWFQQRFRFELVRQLDAVSRPDGHERGRPGFHVVDGGRSRWPPPADRPPVDAAPPAVQSRAELAHAAHAGGHTQVAGRGRAPVGCHAGRGRILGPTAADAGAAEPATGAAEHAPVAEPGDQL